MTRAYTGTDYVVDALERCGVGYAFGNSDTMNCRC